MSTRAPAWPLPAALSIDELGPLGRPLSEGAGESVGVYPLTHHPAWLAKVYKGPKDPAGTKRLDELIALPGQASSRDRALIRHSTAWPVARITDDDGLATGCVLPRASAKFRTDIVTAGSREARFLDVDWLAKPADVLERRTSARPGSTGRLRVCRNLVAVAALLERHGLVYSDWSYSNAFWSRTDLSAFVIDVDGCRPGPVPNVHQPNWEDPLTPESGQADEHTDRYRVALLVARCLTGRRDLRWALPELADSADPDIEVLRDVLLDILLAEDRATRPALTMLADVMAGGPYIVFPPEPVRAPLPEKAGSAAPDAPTPVQPPEPRLSTGTAVAVLILLAVLAGVLLVLANSH